MTQFWMSLPHDLLDNWAPQYTFMNLTWRHMRQFVFHDCSQNEVTSRSSLALNVRYLMRDAQTHGWKVYLVFCGCTYLHVRAQLEILCLCSYWHYCVEALLYIALIVNSIYAIAYRIYIWSGTLRTWRHRLILSSTRQARTKLAPIQGSWLSCCVDVSTVTDIRVLQMTSSEI